MARNANRPEATREDVARSAEELRQQAKEMAERRREEAMRSMQMAREKFEGMKEQARASIRMHPLSSVILAMGIGMMIGSMCAMSAMKKRECY